jgi:hypothetical protein
MCVRTVFTDKVSWSAISGTRRLVGRYRRTRVSLTLTGSRSPAAPAEREQHAVRLGGIERALKGASGGVRFAEGVPRDRLLQ